MEMQNREENERNKRRGCGGDHPAKRQPVHKNSGVGGRAVTVKGWHRKGEQLKEPLPYPDCGLDDVYLLNGYEVVKNDYGTGLVVNDTDGLRAAIARSLAARKKVLSGKEVRFLRKEMDLTQ